MSIEAGGEAVTMSALFTAKLWREYVMNPAQWNETDWETAQAAGLCVRRTHRQRIEKPEPKYTGDTARDVARKAAYETEEYGPVTHKWVLTDAGLDLMNAGKE